MPWKESRAMDERAQFAFNVRSAGMSIAEACRVAGVSRKTGHKWLKRGPVRVTKSFNDGEEALCAAEVTALVRT